ncbi:hypothetical protein CHELA40_12437 [Chelatococcus asaccharovorans]|nr:hypothetical protein CHELA40_12437 [Chelatococcus asaccharovorans]
MSTSGKPQIVASLAIARSVSASVARAAEGLALRLRDVPAPMLASDARRARLFMEEALVMTMVSRLGRAQPLV